MGSSFIRSSSARSYPTLIIFLINHYRNVLDRQGHGVGFELIQPGSCGRNQTSFMFDALTSPQYSRSIAFVSLSVSTREKNEPRKWMEIKFKFSLSSFKSDQHRKFAPYCLLAAETWQLSSVFHAEENVWNLIKLSKLRLNKWVLLDIQNLLHKFEDFLRLR